MVPSTTYELAESILEADILRESVIDRLAAEVLPNVSDDPQELAFALVQRGWLTSYQAEQALQGMAPHLLVGGYLLLTPIGTGGMGQVFKAWQKRLNRVVALKVIRPELLQENAGAVERFRREAMAVARLSHPNIVAIYDADVADGTHFIVLEYVDGPDLERLVNEGGPLPAAQACDYIRQAALGLQHAFEAGLVHRDIKPSNLLIARTEGPRRGDRRRPGRGSGGLVKILDLGLARVGPACEGHSGLTRQGVMMGTPDYIAPEQARDASSADVRSDLYSLGCTFYFLLTGRPPFPDGTTIEKLLQHQEEEPTPIEVLCPDVCTELADIIHRLLAKSPEARLQTPIELADALALILEGAATRAAPAESRPEPPVRPAAGRSDTPPVSGANSPVTIVTAGVLSRIPASGDAMRHEMIAPARKTHLLRGHTGPVVGLCFSPDCRLLCTGGVDSCIRVWSLGAVPHDLAMLEEPLVGDARVLCIAPGGDYLVSGSASPDSCVIRWAWNEPAGANREILDGPPTSDALAFAPDGQSLASASGSSICLWSIGDGLPRKWSVLRNGSGQVRALQFAPGSRHFASGDSSGVVQLWKMGWLKARPSAALTAHSGGVSCLAYSADGRFLASAGVDHDVRVWDGSGATVKARAVLHGTKGVVRQMLFLPDEQMLLTACDGGQVILWKWATATRDLQWRLEQPIICSLALASDGSLVAAGNTDGSATLYDLVPESA